MAIVAEGEQRKIYLAANEVHENSRIKCSARILEARRNLQMNAKICYTSIMDQTMDKDLLQMRQLKLEFNSGQLGSSKESRIRNTFAKRQAGSAQKQWPKIYKAISIPGFFCLNKASRPKQCLCTWALQRTRQNLFTDRRSSMIMGFPEANPSRKPSWNFGHNTDWTKASKKALATINQDAAKQAIKQQTI